MYERRLKTFLIGMGVMAAVILVRLVQLQWVRADEFRRRAQDLLTHVELLPTRRGRILDRHGLVLAQDEARHDFCLDYRMLKGPGSTDSERRRYDRWVREQVRRIARAEKVPTDRAKKIFDLRLVETWELAAELTGVTRNELLHAARLAVDRVSAIRRVVNRRTPGPVLEEYVPHAVATIPDQATAVKIGDRLEQMVGASVRPSHHRLYPRGRDACHVIGQLGLATSREVVPSGASPAEKTTGYLHGDLVGRAGIERACEQLLRGRRGYRRLRRTGHVVEDVPCVFGSDVHLTLDIELQRALSAMLGRPGAIVVLDVPTGEVLAMVSLPTYDLNHFRQLYKQLSTDRADLPLWNRAVAVRYPPGSTIKPVTAAAGLASGKITGSSIISGTGWLISPTFPGLRCWLYKQRGLTHGPLNVVEAMEVSCNSFFFKLGRRIGMPLLVEWHGRFGFADISGTGLPEERAGLLPNLRKVGRNDVAQVAIGQGPIAVTPMHMANAVAAIARDGEYRSGLLVRELAHKQVRRKLGVSPEAVALVQEGMYRVVNGSRGTARKYASDPDIEICGKTGTATTPPRRVDSNGNGRIDSGDRTVRSGDTAWFVGFAPFKDPRIAFAVMVEYSDSGGGRTCGPIARKLVRICRDAGYLGK